MVDRVYKGGISQLRKDLEELRTEFSKLESTTNWVALRVEPVLQHAIALERLSTSRRFAREFTP